jgi:hypothetical protein
VKRFGACRVCCQGHRLWRLADFGHNLLGLGCWGRRCPNFGAMLRIRGRTGRPSIQASLLGPHLGQGRTFVISVLCLSTPDYRSLRHLPYSALGFMHFVTAGPRQ